MIVLGMDISSSYLGLCLMKDGKVIEKIHENSGLTHSEKLAPEILNMLNKNNISVRELDKIICTVGPGSFTGIRIGVAMANSMSLALNIPILGISSLKAMIQSVKGYEGFVMATIDAQRNAYYVLMCEVKDGHYNYLCSEHVATKGEIKNIFEERKSGIIIGDAINNWKDIPEWIKKGDVLSVDPEILCIMDNEAAGNRFIEPVYIRKSQAEMDLERKLGKEVGL